jgi:hypothetical protein
MIEKIGQTYAKNKPAENFFVTFFLFQENLDKIGVPEALKMLTAILY